MPFRSLSETTVPSLTHPRILNLRAEKFRHLHLMWRLVFSPMLKAHLGSLVIPFLVRCLFRPQFHADQLSGPLTVRYWKQALLMTSIVGKTFKSSIVFNTLYSFKFNYTNN